MTPHAALASRVDADGSPARVGLIGTGKHGATVIQRACEAPWESSPTLEALGCRVHVRPLPSR